MDSFLTEISNSASVPAFSHERTGALTQPEFTQLYEANARPILAYVLAVTGRHDVAEDLVQETFCRVLAEKHAARLIALDANEARRYLFRTATNLIRDRWRSRRDHASTSDDRALETASATPPAFSLATSLAIGLDVRAILDRLKPRQRELLWLAYVEGMNHAEIAQATGLARLSVRILLSRACKEARLRLNAPKTRSSSDHSQDQL